MTHPLSHVHALIAEARDWRDLANRNGVRTLEADLYLSIARYTLTEAWASLDDVASPELADEVEALRRVVEEMGGPS